MLTIQRNRSFKFIATITGLTDLSGYTAKCKIATQDFNAVLELDGVIDGMDVAFEATPEQTKELTQDIYYYEIILTNGSDVWATEVQQVKSVRTIKAIS